MATSAKNVKVINGTHGFLTRNGMPWAEVTAFQLKLSKKKEAYNLCCGDMMEHHKTNSVSGTGSVEFYKVDSGTMAEDMEILDGHDHYDTLVGALADPDAEGAERVAAKGVNFDDIPISDWKAGANGKITRAFTFEGIQLLDLIPVR